LIPPLIVFWTNTHGGALGGVATVVVVALAWLVMPRGTVRPPMGPALPRNLCSQAHHSADAGASNRPEPLLLCLVAAFSIIAVLVNPYGSRLPAVWLGLSTSAILPQLIIEHAPLRFVSIEAAMVLSLAALYIYCLARAWPTHRRIAWLVPLLWLVMTFSRVRHGPLFAVTAALAIADMLACLCRQPVLASGCIIHDQKFRIQSYFIPAAVVLAAFSLQCAGLRIPLIGAGWCRADPSYWPVKTAAVLREEIDRRPGARVFNDMLFGGYLVYAVPSAKVFIDDRCELYGDQSLVRYMRLCSNAGLFNAVAAYDDIHYALVMADSPLDRRLASDPTWTRLSAETSASLYRRGS
jgi:hypothetical protein